MKSEWQTILIDAGAELADGGVESFGNPERERQIATTGDTLCDLSHCGLISVHGAEARNFLQNQFSSDVGEVSLVRSQLSSYCSPKGRVLACFRLFLRDGVYYLRLPQEMLDPTLKRLGVFVLRSKITLASVSEALVRFGYSGPDAEVELQQTLGAYPLAVNDCVHARGVTVIRIPGPHPRFELHGELTAMERVWSRLNVRAAPVGMAAWALLDTLAGIPNVLAASCDRFLPQMLNLDLLGAVSFKKGCYPGQEIIARMRYLGSLKRRMYRVHIATESVPQPGEAIMNADEGEVEPAGGILDAQAHPDGCVAALAVLRADALDDRLRLGTATGAAVEIKTLPYSLDP